MTDSSRRWRLVLGRYAERSMPTAHTLDKADQRVDRVLGHLYDRGYADRGHRHARGTGGGLDPSAITALTWLHLAGELFPRSTVERMQRQAIEEYGMTDLLADPEVVEALDPSPELASALLAVRGRLDPGLEAGIRRLIERVVAQVVARIRPRFTSAFLGRRNRHRRSPLPVAQNFDALGTIRENLRHYDPQSGRLVVQRLRFDARVRRRLTWDVILLVDQSGSMASSVLYSAVCAGIMSALPGVQLRLLLFDTAVADLTHLAADPVAVLMTAQLGGGTDIAGALRTAESMVHSPARTVVMVVSDFEEGGSVTDLVATTRRLRTAGVTLLGLAALDEQANPVHDPVVAGRLAAVGMEIAALTPDHLAEWLAEVMR
ncbi:VWA domain-containing protein [Cellulomonas sp. NPDC089187]|uniref:VWA domain-containing protein n=1 Tax=Cellulomonas sp. NPDC089187 TaxID=3154970 RepID=UPI003441B7C0